MHKSLLALTTGVLLGTQALAGDGYKIKVKFNDIKDSMITLAHYYGKPLPTIYKLDSAYFDKNGVATLESKEKITGGIYLILNSNKEFFFEFLLNNGDDMGITADMKNLPSGVKFKNSPENEGFTSYVTFLENYGKKQQQLQEDYKAARNSVDSASLRRKSADLSKELTEYRRSYAKKNPNTQLANIFKALEVPQVPEGKHLLPSGEEDSAYSYNYYKDHFWDGFDFTDDRLVLTPIYDAKLDEYFNKLVLPWPDSVKKEADVLLAKTRGHKELFKYTLWWTTRNTETSKIMGMDEAFVYLVENYYMKGDADWLDKEGLARYIDRAQKIAPNVIGNIAPELKMKDINGKEHSLLDMKAKYTALIFWTHECGHCTEEMPRIDSLYKAVLKDKGVKIYAVKTDGDVTKWQEFVKKHNMTDWLHVYDADHTQPYKSQYDVYSTPVIYLLDEKKIIRGKRLDHNNLATLIEMLEKKDKTTNKTTKS